MTSGTQRQDLLILALLLLAAASAWLFGAHLGMPIAAAHGIAFVLSLAACTVFVVLCIPGRIDQRREQEPL